jgi:hypothetical protein
VISKRVTRVVCTAASPAGLLLTGLAGPASAASTGRRAEFTTFPGRLYDVADTDANNVWADHTLR